jgi:Cdc6-like AAA superfamily ATPase
VLKRSASYIDLTDDLHEEHPVPKKAKSEAPELTVEERYELDQIERRAAPAPVQEMKIELSPEQEKVVKMALRKDNIFLTGAAGCGKTVTLKEILARLKKKKKGGNVQVVAPTGIAALPLDGKTTYSFAGVSETSFQSGKRIGLIRDFAVESGFSP